LKRATRAFWNLLTHATRPPSGSPGSSKEFRD
jgi:hypothetical protein